MTPEQFKRAESLFKEAKALTVEERSAFLLKACPDDPQLREKVERMLKRAEHPIDEIVSPARSRLLGGLGNILSGQAGTRKEILQIGRYTIIRKIGEGGMGTVYEARQDHPSRTVALKIIRPGIASTAVLKRFTHEAHVLGQLQHPGIACIYEAGIADVQQSPSEGAAFFPVQSQFFAMELIRGQALTDFATEHKLTTPERLELFAKIYGEQLEALGITAQASEFGSLTM